MDTVADAQPLSSASELWRRLERDRILQPKSYDRDIVEALEAELPTTGSIATRMDDAKWTARDLLRAMSPTLDSFAELLTDLLALYTEISAWRATESDLLISYEFEEGDTFDQSLEQFRRAGELVSRFQAARGSFLPFALHEKWVWGDPPSVELNAMHAMRPEHRDSWRFDRPKPPATKNPSLPRGVSLVFAVLTAACETLRSYGADMHAVGNSVELHSAENADTDLRLYSDFTDFLSEYVLLALQRDVETLENAPQTRIDDWLKDIEKWSSRMWGSDAADAEELLSQVLALPMWGKRHELYSAWIVCVFDAALGSRGLRFEVVEGTLSFPFKATRIASFEDSGGDAELWSEVRLAASGDLTHGLKAGVQPDYRFLRSGSAPAEAEMAVEVKQYRRSAGKRHGETARDYARALPQAKIVLVAHGPIGDSAEKEVDASDIDRVSFRPDVRSLRSTQSQSFIEELRSAFPPARKLTGLVVHQSCVEETRVLAVNRAWQSQGSWLLQGPETHQVDSDFDAELLLFIVCHPDAGHSIDSSGARVTLNFSDGSSVELVPAPHNSGLVWHIGRVFRGVFTRSSGTEDLSSQPSSTQIVSNGT